MVQFRVQEELCTQCGECAADCPAGIIAMHGHPRMTDESRCYRCQHCLAVCPTGAVSVLGKDPAASVPLDGTPVDPGQLAALIKGRRSVRRYTGKDLPQSLIDELIAVAWHAPTGVNSQSVLFTVVREARVMAGLREEAMSGLARLASAGKMPDGFVGQYMGAALTGWQAEGKDIIFRGAPHLLLTSAAKNAPCPVQDTHIALTTFQLMAHARGVGTLWDGMVMMVLALLPDLRKRLGVPDDHQLGYAMVFGEPAVNYHRTVQRGPARVNAVQ